MHCVKQLSPSDVSDSGIVSEDNDEHSEKQ
jgi:hypothetical protein